jgi:hypothetical protein
MVLGVLGVVGVVTAVRLLSQRSALFYNPGLQELPAVLTCPITVQYGGVLVGY